MVASARLRVLVVDNHPATAEATAVMLTLDGHEVVTANSGASGFAKAVSLRPELALIHIGLPDMDGYEVARQIQALQVSPKPFLVAVPDSAIDEDKLRCAQAGFDLCLPEPISHMAFEALADLLLLSKGIVARSRDIAEQNRAVVTTLILRHMEIAHTLLNSAAASSTIQTLKERCIARAKAAHDRVATWLDTDACDDRRPKVVHALGELRARLFP